MIIFQSERLKDGSPLKALVHRIATCLKTYNCTGRSIKGSKDNAETASLTFKGFFERAGADGIEESRHNQVHSCLH